MIGSEAVIVSQDCSWGNKEWIREALVIAAVPMLHAKVFIVMARRTAEDRNLFPVRWA